MPELRPGLELAINGGSGLVVDENRGLILTCEQLIAGASRVVVVLPDGRELESTRVVYDPRSELALLAVDPRAAHLTAADWGESERAQLGEWVLAVGRVGGQGQAVSAGIISGRGPGPRPGNDDDVLWTDAVISHANAGGPLVDLQGRVIGMNCPRFDPRPGAERFGQAIPADRARRVASDLAEFGHVRRGYLGLMVEPGSNDPLDGRGGAAGLLVTGVTPGSPAADAGIQPGDRIQAIDGQAVKGLAALSRAVDEAPVGKEFRLLVDRNGKQQEFSVKSRQRPDPAATSGAPRPLPGGADRRLRPRDRLRGAPLPPRRSGSLESEPAEEKTPAPPQPAPAPSTAPGS
jgi:serine protease Do